MQTTEMDVIINGAFESGKTDVTVVDAEDNWHTVKSALLYAAIKVTDFEQFMDNLPIAVTFVMHGKSVIAFG